MFKYYRKTTLLKKCGPQICLCSFMFRLTTGTLCAVVSGGVKVTPKTAVREVPGSIPGSGKGFYACFSLFCCFYFCPKHIICHGILQFRLQC